MSKQKAKKDPNAQKVKKNAIYHDQTQQAHFWAKPPFQATNNTL